jgi:hypothetical protein
LFLALKDDAAEAATNDSFSAAGAANQVAPKTMERPQLIFPQLQPSTINKGSAVLTLVM